MSSIPVIDLRAPNSSAQIGEACAENGFFCIVGHGVNEALQLKLESLSKKFFALPNDTKNQIAMEKAGKAWRGFFPVGNELTSGAPDLKEGIYFGEELEHSDFRVSGGWPLHGANLFPEIPEFKETVLEYMSAMTTLGHRLMEELSLSLGLPKEYFNEHYTKDPTLLFRIFHYPPTSAELDKKFPWGVGEHTDYGVLTILKQDDCGGLEVKTKDRWIQVPPIPGAFVCNIGDMLDFLTRGRYRSSPHRVRNTSGRERYSYPFFFDPGFSAKVMPLPMVSALPERMADRWDHENLYAFQGTYRDYLLGKVSKVFPNLADSQKLR